MSCIWQNKMADTVSILSHEVKKHSFGEREEERHERRFRYGRLCWIIPVDISCDYMWPNIIFMEETGACCNMGWSCNTIISANYEWTTGVKSRSYTSSTSWENGRSCNSLCQYNRTNTNTNLFWGKKVILCMDISLICSNFKWQNFSSDIDARVYKCVLHL